MMAGRQAGRQAGRESTRAGRQVVSCKGWPIQGVEGIDMLVRRW